MKKLIAILVMIMLTTTVHADRYYGDSSKVPYVKSSNRSYEKSWNSWARHQNIGINVARTRAVSDRLNGRSSSGYSDDYSYRNPPMNNFNEVDAQIQKCVNAIKSDTSKGDNTNTFQMRKQRLACSTIEKY